MTLKNGLVALATFALATSATAATANANPFAQDKAILTLQDLDLSTADGQQRLAIRVDQAARAVCGENLSGLHLSLEAKAQECRTAVTADVRAQIEARLAKAGSISAIRLAAAR
jgi:UrcA family protein